MSSSKLLKVYGISQNPDTKDYIIILQYEKGENYKIQCENCGEKFIGRSYAKYEWCKPCQLKENFTNWTSEHEKVDNLIQEIQLSINYPFKYYIKWMIDT